LTVRCRIRVEGVVQGVGFRPFVHRLAREEGLTGFVRNDARGVCLEVQGERCGPFVERLRTELPSPGEVQRCTVTPLEAVPGEAQFVIERSREAQRTRCSLAPDLATCAECLREMGDPRDRRHRHPFLTCTRCGPRYTITRSLPYDRPGTTMAAFPMCAECRREYEDVADRRHHAQPVSCPACGPRAWLARPGDGGARHATDGHDPAVAIDAARALLRDGAVLAVKGIGGFHLAVDARNETAVRLLRERKRRSRKPFALMAADLDAARRMVRLDQAAEKLLASPAAPIVIAPTRPGNGIGPSVAPGIADLGVMLPYSPLHHLLLSDPALDALVMTSGNAPAEPICCGNDDALASLPADAFLLHDRGIHVACDDSVVRATPEGPMPVRRSRGFVPRALDASFLPHRNVLALGAELKATVTTLQEGELVPGRHLGDLDNPRAEAAFRAEVERVLRFARMEPQVVAVDAHPDLFTSQFARERFPGAELVRVQHHHAHLAAVLVEHEIASETRVIGILLDGLGWGPDGTVWGGEVLEGSYREFRRVARLRPVPQPGGDAAARRPHRMATSLLRDAGLAGGPGWDGAIAQVCGIPAVSPLTSSTGRLFDGVAAMLAVAPEEQDYEGEAAILLEAAADDSDDAYPLPLSDGDPAELDTRVLVRALVEDPSPAGVRAARFHNGLADGMAAAALSTGPRQVVLGGGCMVNRRLLSRLVRRLREGGAEPLVPKSLPPGDGGLSAGQAAVAACSEG